MPFILCRSERFSVIDSCFGRGIVQQKPWMRPEVSYTFKDHRYRHNLSTLQTSASLMRSAQAVTAFSATLSQAEHSLNQQRCRFTDGRGVPQTRTWSRWRHGLVQRPWKKKDKVDYHVTIPARKQLPTRLSALMQLAMVRIPRPPRSSHTLTFAECRSWIVSCECSVFSVNSSQCHQGSHFRSRDDRSVVQDATPMRPGEYY